MKFSTFKTILTSVLIVFTCTAFADEIGSLIPKWKQKQGYLIFSVPVKLQKFIPTKTNNAHTIYLLPLVFEPLITIGSKKELLPVLAKSWVVSSDKKSVVITINPNHHFSDGHEVTATDVVESFYRACSPGAQTYTRLSGLSGCYERASQQSINPTKVSAIGKYEVQFNITSSPTNFLYQLSYLSAVVTKKVGNKLIGSGPYLLNEQQEDYVVLDKNDQYKGKNQAMNAGMIFFYANQNTVSKHLSKDHSDGAIIYRMADIQNFNNSQYKLIKSNPNIAELLVLNNNRYPFNKSIVRKALAASLYNNFNHSCISGARHAYGIIPTGIGGSINGISPKKLPEYTPKQVFKQVPQLRKRKVIVTIHQLDDLKLECESVQIQETAKKYNINVKFKYHKNYSKFVPLIKSHEVDGFIELFVYLSMDANSILNHFAKAGGNDANISDDNVDRMLNDAITAQSSHTRYQAYNHLAKYMQDQGIVIPLFYMNHGTILSNCLLGIPDDFYISSFISLPKLHKNLLCKN